VSGAERPVTVTILDKDYLISCSDEERDQLHTAAAFLNQKMKEMKSAGKIVGTERIAVMVALNIAHQLLACRQQSNETSTSIDSTIRRLHSKIDEALTQRGHA
jgi:cell division protein ZapA